MKKYFLFILGIAFLISCDKEDFDLNLQENPNQLNESSSDPNFVLNGILLNAITVNQTLGASAESLVRMSHQFGTYTGPFSSANADAANDAWFSTYSLIANVKLMETIADQQGLPLHKGVAQICEASAIIDLVDAVGDVVYSEAANVDFPQPSLDDDADVYVMAIARLDEAITNLGTDAAAVVSPIVGNAGEWLKIANSLKLKAYIQSRLVNSYTSEINAIVSSGNYITSNSDDFQFDFSTSIAPTDSRHFLFQQNYLTGANNYQSNYFY